MLSSKSHCTGERISAGPFCVSGTPSNPCVKADSSWSTVASQGIFIWRLVDLEKFRSSACCVHETEPLRISKTSTFLSLPLRTGVTLPVQGKYWAAFQTSWCQQSWGFVCRSSATCCCLFLRGVASCIKVEKAVLIATQQLPAGWILWFLSAAFLGVVSKSEKWLEWTAKWLGVPSGASA